MKDFSYLKVGDPVFIYCGNALHLAQVTKITPSGRINTQCGNVFLPNGREYGGGYYRTWKLKPYNDEYKTIYEKQQTVSRAKKYVNTIDTYSCYLNKLDGEVLAETALNLEKISVLLEGCSDGR